MTISRIPSVEGGIQPTLLTAKGDLISATAASTVARLPVGSDTQILVADSTASTGLKWATTTLSGLSLLNSGGTALTGATTITVSSISPLSRLMIYVAGGSSANASSAFRIRFNGDSGSNYAYAGIELTSPSTVGYGSNFSETGIVVGIQQSSATNTMSTISHFIGTGGAGYVQGTTTGTLTGSGSILTAYNGWYNASAAITSVSLISSSGNFDAGTLYVYGA